MSIVSENAPRYRRGSRRFKSQMLDELSSLTHYHRKYLSSLLRYAGQEVYTPEGLRIIADPHASLVSQRRRKKIYTEDLLPSLVLLWELVRRILRTGCISSVHLAAFINCNHDFLFAHPKLKKIPLDRHQKLRTMSPATIDRLLKPVREQRKLKGTYKSNPHASSIKKTIPVQPHYEKPKNLFGYLECDLVHHCGESAGGMYTHTLTATEITTGWTELRTLRNRAQVWTVNALKEIIGTVPFRVTHLHSDNGSEFLNAHLQNVTADAEIPFTRSRPFRKNDAPYAESKNWSLVRVYTGYRRYDTEEELSFLQPLTRLISLKHNLFIPTMKLREKQRKGGRVHKTYTTATPYHRLLHSERLTAEEKRTLTELRTTTDFFDLIHSIQTLQRNLDRAYHKKYHSQEVVCV